MSHSKLKGCRRGTAKIQNHYGELILCRCHVTAARGRLIYAMELGDDEDIMSVLGICSGWGGICGDQIPNGELIWYFGHLFIIGSLVNQRHAIIHMHVVS